MPKEQLDKARISRRFLVKATGATVLLGSVPYQHQARVEAAQNVRSASLPPIGDKKPRPKSLDFLSDEGFRNAKLDGKAGFEVRLRVTEYRSMNLDDVLDITVAVDGKAIRTEDITFLLDGHRNTVPELRHQRGVYWEARDYARLFILKEGGLSAGEHEIEVRMQKRAGAESLPVLAFEVGKKRMTLEADE